MDIENNNGWTVELLLACPNIPVEIDITQINKLYKDKLESEIEKIQYQINPGKEFWSLIKQEFPNMNKFDLFK